MPLTACGIAGPGASRSREPGAIGKRGAALALDGNTAGERLARGRPVILRDLKPEDQAAWRVLWLGYLAFYGQVLAEEITQATWRRLLDPSSPLHGRVAEASSGALLGFCHYVLHQGSWTMAPICYPEDLFVQPQHRGGGTGRALIEDVLAQARSKGWSRLYWHTRAGNATARRLYDTFAPADGFVRYRIFL